MSLDTYANLRAEIASLLNRSDLTTSIPGWIALCEADMNARLRVRQMVGRATASITDGYSEVPSDYLGAISMSVTGQPHRLRYLTPEQYDQALQVVQTGPLGYYSIVGNEFSYYPSPPQASTAQLTYYRSIPALSDAQTTNWLLAKYPAAYLYGSLIHSAPKLRDDARIELWTGLYAATIQAIERASQSESYGDLNMMGSPGFTP